VTSPLGSLKRGEEFRLLDGREGTVVKPVQGARRRVVAIVEAAPVGKEMLLPFNMQVHRLGRISPNYR
jgi:hypothetical protein